MAGDDVTITIRANSGDAIRAFRDVNGQLRDMRSRFVTEGGLMTRSMNQVSSSVESAGGSMGRLAPAVGSVGAAVGVSLLPAIGAAAPLLAGFGTAGGAAALAMGGMKKQAKELKGPLEDWRKAAEKVILPRTAKAVGTLKGAMKDLTPVIETGGRAFGEIAESAAKFADSPAFKGALIRNVEMGSGFVKAFADNMGTFTQSFLDFGTKSQPTVDALQNLVGGAFGKGMPSMFKELEQGVDGSADVIDGLAYLVNDSLLPSLGKVAGSFADSFGPLVGEMLVTAGDQVSRLATLFDGAAEALEPLANVGADAFRAFNELAAIGTSVAGSFAKEVGGALFESLTAVAGVDVSELDDGFRGLSNWVKDNQGAIRSAMLGVAQSITTMVTAGVEALPTLFSAFRTVTEGIILGVDGLVSTLAGTFGNLPGIGDTFKDWNKSFDEVAGGFRDSMDDIGGTIDSFAGEAVPRLNRAKITMSVDQAEANLEHLKQQLKDPELTAERKAKLTADKKEAEGELAAAKRELAAFDKASAKAKLDADSGPFAEALRWVKQQSIPKKTGMIVANTSGFWSGVRGLAGKVLGTSYINVQYRKVDSSASPTFRAMGGPIRRLADGGSPEGGRVVGPGSETSDSIPAMLSAGEYVVRASSVRKYGERFLNDLNEGRLKVTRFAKGGGVRSLARGARDEIRDATSGATEKRLLSLMDTISRGHIKMATALKKVSSELDKASSKLKDLKSSATQLANSVKSGIISGANITKAAGAESSQVTINTLLSTMTGSAANAKQFDKMLKTLRKRGLSKDLLAQIAEAGIEGGGMETAAAILGGGSSEIKTLNQLQSQISKAAGSAGKTTADAVYGKQIKAQEKLVKSLDRLADVLKVITTAASARAKARKKARKKAAGGIGGGLTWVGEEGPELVRLPQGSTVYPAGQSRHMAWASMLTTPPQPAPPAPTPGRSTASGWGDRPLTIVLQVGNTELGEVAIDPVRKAITTRGGLKAVFPQDFR